MSNKETKELDKFIIKKSKETEKIFDLYSEKEKVRRIVSGLRDEMESLVNKCERLKKEFDYKKSLFWNEVEDYLEYDDRMRISDDSNDEEIVILKLEEDDENQMLSLFKEFLKDEILKK
jgi:hypothetical protein